MSKLSKAEEIEAAKFWFVYCDEQDNFKKITIDQLLFCRFLTNAGFLRFDIDQESVFVQILNSCVIKIVTITQIQDFVYSWIKDLPAESEFQYERGFTKDRLLGKMLSGVSFYFNRQKLYYLKPEQEIVFNRDTLKEKFIYYTNGFVCVTTNGSHFRKYSELKNRYIWESQILKRNIDLTKPIKSTDVERFMNYVSGEKQDRLRALEIAIGYYIHDFTDYKLKSLLLTDSSISADSEANGRTGKTLFCRLVGYMVSADPLDPAIKSYIEVNGKDFKSDDKHKYSQANIDTKLVVINDLRRNFDPDAVYNDITEGITIDKKNQQPMKARVKMILTTNKTVKMDGASSRDRFVEFEFSDYFSDTKTPEDVFKHWFFRDWSDSQWNDYDRYMINAVHKFFMNGAKLEQPSQINLNERKLIESTSAEFVEYMREMWKPVPGFEYDKNLKFINFKHEYPDFDKLKQATFTKWIKYYCNLGKEYSKWDNNRNQGRTGDMRWYKFFTKE